MPTHLIVLIADEDLIDAFLAEKIVLQVVDIIFPTLSTFALSYTDLKLFDIDHITVNANSSLYHTSLNS